MTDFLIRPVFEDLLKSEKNKKKESKKPLGTCVDMCPKEEIDFRIRNHLIHPMETSNPFIQMRRSERKAVIQKMVKEYSRPAANKKLNLKNVRTFPTLMDTVDYLLSIYDNHQDDSQWLHVYSFVSDRFRAIRQDLIVQQLSPREIVKLLEPMIPFYLKAKKKCEKLNTSAYDKKLHNSELDECFSRWICAANQGAEVDPDITKAYVYFYLDKNGTPSEILETFGCTNLTSELIATYRLSGPISDISD